MVASLRNKISEFPSRVVCLSFWISSLVGLFSFVSIAQTLQRTFPVTNGTVNAITKSGSTVYLGGTFTYVGPQTGYGVSLDTTTSNYDTGFPYIDGPVYVILSDSAGGWYIGGHFTQVGGVARSGIAHIKSNKTVDTWNPKVTSTSTTSSQPAVWAIEKHGSLFYVGGMFDKVGDSTRTNLAAIDSATGIVNSWNPGTDSYVYTIQATDTIVYVGGAFTKTTIAMDTVYNTNVRHGVAAIYTWNNGKTLSPWAPAFAGSKGYTATVYQGILIGTNFYMCGDFASINGITRYGLGAVVTNSYASGVTSWNPAKTATSPQQIIYAMRVVGGVMYVGGDFVKFGRLTNLGTIQTRYRLAKVYMTGQGLLMPWDPQVSPLTTTYNANIYVRTMNVTGSMVYAGGLFDSIGTSARFNIASVDSGTAAPLLLNPGASDIVYAVGGNGSASMLAGGQFFSVNGQPRNNLASFDATTGTVSSWNPSPDNSVTNFAVSGSQLFVAGYFANIGGSAHNVLASFDMTTGNLTAGFNQSPNAGISAMLVVGDTLYIGGSFATVGVVTRNHIAAITISSGTLKSWNPNADGGVNSLAISGSTIYAGGAFSNIGGQARQYLAAISTADTGSATSWNPTTVGNTNGAIYNMVISGNTLYAGGSFTTIGGQARNNLTGVDLTSGTIRAFNPFSTNVGNTSALANYGSTMYVGGNFTTTVGGASRHNIAAIDTGTGSASSWNPNLIGNGIVGDAINAIFLDVPNHIVYMGGQFDSLAGQQVNFFGAYTDISALPVELTTFTAAAKGSTAELHWKTATETDNYGFDVERRMLGGNNASAWMKVGFVHGAGTSASPHDYAFSDRQLPAGRYGYRIRQIDNAGSSKYTQAIEIEVGSVPLKLTLSQNYPNPFNPTTMISFTLPNDGRAVLKIFNVIGQEVATLFDQEAAAGKVYQAQFDAAKLPTGIYFSRLEFGGNQLVRKLLLVK